MDKSGSVYFRCDKDKTKKMLEIEKKYLS